MFGFGSRGARGNNLQRVVAGLGSLSTRAGTPSNDARRVVSAFAEGRAASSGCGGGAEGRTCEMTTDGLTLRVGTTVLASRSAPNVDTLRVCIPGRLPAGNRAQAGGIKAVAQALMQVLKTGIGVRRAKDSTIRLAGRHGRAKVEIPKGECLTINLTTPMREAAAKNFIATSRLKADKPGRNPSRKQVQKKRKEMAAADRNAGLELAREAKVAKAKAATKAAKEKAKKAKARAKTKKAAAAAT